MYARSSLRDILKKKEIRTSTKTTDKALRIDRLKYQWAGHIAHRTDHLGGYRFLYDDESSVCRSPLPGIGLPHRKRQRTVERQSFFGQGLCPTVLWTSRATSIHIHYVVLFVVASQAIHYTVILYIAVTKTFHNINIILWRKNKAH